MFHKIASVALVLSVASSVLASPLSSSSYTGSAKTDIVNRQFQCPPGVECGPGPECTPALCDLPGCADAEACQTNQDRKRSLAAALVGRQFGCPTGSGCGPGPECAGELCDDPACADAPLCQGNEAQKRSAETDIVHPICDICIVGDNGQTVCGCATPSGGPQRRGTEKVCPLFCITTDNGDTLCGCAAEDYENSLNGSQPKA